MISNRANSQNSPTGGRGRRPNNQQNLRRPNNQQSLLRAGGGGGLLSSRDRFIQPTAPRRKRPFRPRTTTTTTSRPLIEHNVFDYYYDEFVYDEQYECPPRDQSYSTPDPVQCDK